MPLTSFVHSRLSARGTALFLSCFLLLGGIVRLQAQMPAPTDRDLKPDVPLKPAGQRKLVVAQDGTGKFKSIQAAVDVSQPGDTILVKNGTYAESPTFTRSGSKALPIVLVNFPGHHPVIVPEATYEHGVVLKAEWIIVEGFEIREGYNGMIVYKGHNTIRGNYIHNNGDRSDPAVTCGQGILLVSSKDVLITRNRIERNGLKNRSPFHIHGIYLSDYYHTEIARIAITNNIIREHGGGGFHAFMSSDAGSCRNILIASNLFENNAHEIICVHMSDSLLRNNTLRHNQHPATNSPDSTLFWFELSPRNVVLNNQITSTFRDAHYYTVKVMSAGESLHFEGNRWKIPAKTAWIWQGQVQTDFNGKFPSQTEHSDK